MKCTVLWLAVATLALLVRPAFAPAELPPLIPRQVLFGNPDHISPTISPDGKRLAYLAPDDGVLNVWIRTIGQTDDRAVTKDRKRGIRSYFWAENNRHILYSQDRDGDENWHVYAVDLDAGNERDLTPFENVQARIIATERNFPDEILVSINQRDPQLHDVYRCDLLSGELKPAAENDRGFVGWLADPQFQIRAALKPTRNGGTLLQVRDDADSTWRTLLGWGPEDALTSGPVAFTADGASMHIISSAEVNTGQLRLIDLQTRKQSVLAADDEADVAGLLIHPQRHVVQAVSFKKDRAVWKVLDDTVAGDFEAIRGIRTGDFGVINRDHTDRTWLLYYETDDGPIYYYAYDRERRKGELLFTSRPELERLTLATMKPIVLTARDGLTLHGYLTTPPGVPAKNLPLVVDVHGGPWYRDSWGYDGEVQWLANRGYAVLQVNFRGSTGYGKKFLNAGNREWGGKMHDDLIDAVQWAVEQGVADPARIGIYGGSYGGYAALVGLTFTPDVFACGVSIVGPSNLITFMKTIPPYWKPIEPIFFDRVGHPKKDAEFLKSRSPLYQVDRIRKPLLIAQGANDPRVKKSESRQIVEALEQAGKVVKYLEYADEGHGFARPENRLDFFAHAEQFLAEHLGGRFEPPSSDEAAPAPPKVD